MADNDAMALIRRAAILLEERGEGCKTPGASYRTDYRNGRITCEVTLTDQQAEMLNAQLGQAYKRPYCDALIHDYMQVAIWRILEGKLV